MWDLEDKELEVNDEINDKKEEEIGKKFDKLAITTSTHIVELNGAVDYLQVFPLLMITKIKTDMSHNLRKKIIIPYTGHSGDILSATTHGFTRGIKRSKKSFLHCIGMDVSTSIKNINVKLSEKSIHMCGSKSEELTREAAEIIIKKIYEAQDLLDYIKENHEKVVKTLKWIEEKTKGEKVYIYKGTNVMVDSRLLFNSETNKSNIKYKYNGHALIPYLSLLFGDGINEEIFNKDMEIETENKIIIPVEYPDNYPSFIDKRIANFFIEQHIPDFSQHSLYIMNLYGILKLEQVVKEPVSINRILKSLVNYNYDIGFIVDRWELKERLNGLNGFIASYNAKISYQVTIKLLYTTPDHLRDKIRRKKEREDVSFTVYKSGKVTQSGPCEEINKWAYILLIKTLETLRPHIEYNIK